MLSRVDVCGLDCGRFRVELSRSCRILNFRLIFCVRFVRGHSQRGSQSHQACTKISLSRLLLTYNFSLDLEKIT